MTSKRFGDTAEVARGTSKRDSILRGARTFFAPQPVGERSCRYAVGNQAQKDGIANLRQSAIKKVIAGLTSLEEINRVTKD